MHLHHLIVLSVAAVLPVCGPTQEQRFALAIGINDYREVGRKRDQWDLRA